MYKTLLNALFFFLLVVPVSGQEILNTSNNWYFGDRAGLDFNTSPPTVLTDGQLDTQEGVATISDNNGALLFYTDGVTVWDQTHQIMPGANGVLNGHFSSTQSSIIIPNIGNNHLYYIFTTDELGGSDGLAYTTIDMSLPGNGSAGTPLGDVIPGTLNIQLSTPVTEKLTGVLKPDCTGYWVIAHGWNNNRFLVYEVTSDGVNPVPVISNVGNIHSGGSNNNNAVGYMKISSDGQKLALVNRANGTIDVYDFNNVNGAVSNEVEIVPNDPLTYGIEFSPGGHYLYIGGEFLVSRYEFGSGTLTDVPIDDPFAWGGSEVVRALQLGPDENIYISVRYSEYLSAIYDPDGMNPTISAYAIFLDPDNTGRNCRFGLPNIFYRDFSPNAGTGITLNTCPGGEVFYNGSFYPEGSVNEISLMGTNGCDSSVILTVEPFVVSNEIIETTTCEGHFYDFNGNLIEAGSQQTFTFSDANGCDSVVTVVVNISDEESDLAISLCPGETYLFNNAIYTAGTDTTFFFQNANGCDSLINLTVSASSEVNFSLNTENACWNMNTGSISAQDINGGVPPYTFSLDGQPFVAQPVFENLPSGVYTFFVRDANQCLFEQTIEIAETNELQIEVTDPVFPCDLDSLIISVNLLSGDPNGISWNWSNGSDQQQTTIFQTGTYSLIMSNPCQTLETTINVQREGENPENFFYIPNVFSPNGDGFNDRFEISPKKDLEVVDFEIHIFNRWGDLLFESRDLDFSWDGSFLATKMNNGVYVWWISATVISCHEPIEIFDKGDVAVIR